MENTKHNQVKRNATMGLLVALAYASLYVVRVPIIPSAPFLRFDVKDVFIAIGGLIFGPYYALIGAVCVSVLQMFSVSEYGLIGLLMNVISVSAFTVPTAFVYKKVQNTKGLISGLALSCISMTAVMLLWNYLVTPLYMGVSREVVQGMILPAFLPFNLIKSTVNAMITFFTFKSMAAGGVIQWVKL